MNCMTSISCSPTLKAQHFDAVFAWDLLNYLQPLALQILMSRLITFCRRDTLLFAMIYTDKQMPNALERFRIAAEDHLQYAPCSGQTHSSLQYSRPTLLGKLPDSPWYALISCRTTCRSMCLGFSSYDWQALASLQPRLLKANRLIIQIPQVFSKL